jgi:hypothetical protein
VRPKNKGFKNPFEKCPTPCKTEKKSTHNNLGTIQEWICAQNQPKILRKMEDFEENGFRVGWGQNRKFGDFRWPAVAGHGGEWPTVVFWWWGRRWVVVGWCILDVWEEEGRR